jgi:hypothetical protein
MRFIWSLGDAVKQILDADHRIFFWLALGSGAPEDNVHLHVCHSLGECLRILGERMLPWGMCMVVGEEVGLSIIHESVVVGFREGDFQAMVGRCRGGGFRHDRLREQLHFHRLGRCHRWQRSHVYEDGGLLGLVGI